MLQINYKSLCENFPSSIQFRDLNLWVSSVIFKYHFHTGAFYAVC